jgi:hypothetical protein
MTPGMYITLARDVGVAIALGFLLWRVFSAGEDRVKASDLKSLQVQIAEQARIVDQWHTEATAANDQFAKELHSINSAPVVVHDWVRTQPSCAKAVLPGAASSPGGSAAAGGGDQPVSGATADGSRRDVILADWKRFWETRLAGCRLEHAQWPQP